MPESLTLAACAKKFNRSEEEVTDALVALGLIKRATKGMRLDDDKILHLTNHFRSTQKAASAEGSGSTVRKIASTEVTERKVRARGERAGGAAIARLRQQKAGSGSSSEASKSAAADAGASSPAKTKKPEPASTAAGTKKTPATAKKSDSKKTDADEKKTAAKKVAPSDSKKTTATTTAKKTAAKAVAPTTAAAKQIAAPPPPPDTPPPAADTDSAPAAKAAEQAASATPPPPPAPSPPPEETRTSHLEQLLHKQQLHKEQLTEKEKQLREAREKKAAAPPPPKPTRQGETIRLDKSAVDKHRKKRTQNISRSAAREITAESQHTFKKPTAPVVREVKIPDAISITKLASETALKSGVIIRKLMDHGMSVTANEVLDKETAWILVEELGHKPVEAPDDNTTERELLKRDVTGEDIQPRAPVVTVMGHVDHGKTSLLDHIRKTRVAPGEAGGITQHIGAYRVETKVGAVTFLDTPGHALFSQMRARGAKVTDIVLLVVAADDGVKPQTIEAINHAKAAKVPIIVAANKIDKPEADMERVKRELSQHEVLPEDWGGDAIVVPVSAATGEGVDKLLEALAMQSELLELTAPLDVPAVGVVIEARVDKGRGIVATLVMTRGVLKTGNAFLCGTESGRVRTMWNLSHPKLDAALPSIPVEMQGLSGIPEAGAELLVVEDERTAREVAAMRQDKLRLSKMTSRRLPAASANDQAAALLDAASDEREWKELHVIVKADVEGSREAMVAALTEIKGKHAGVKVIHSAVGTVTESDIYLAQAGGGLIMSFNVRPDSRARKLAESRGVKIIAGSVVYELVEKAHEAVLGLLAPIVEESVIGTATVLRVFNISKVGNIAGCRVEEGIIRSKSPLRLLRDGVTVHEGTMSSLHHFKDEASEIRAGSECGIGISKYNDIKAGDVIEALERTESAPEL